MLVYFRSFLQNSGLEIQLLNQIQATKIYKKSVLLKFQSHPKRRENVSLSRKVFWIGGGGSEADFEGFIRLRRNTTDFYRPCFLLALFSPTSFESLRSSAYPSIGFQRFPSVEEDRMPVARCTVLGYGYYCWMQILTNTSEILLRTRWLHCARFLIFW